MSALNVAIGVLAGGVLLLLGGAARRRVFAQDRSIATLLDLPGEAIVDPRSISASRLDRIIELFFAPPSSSNSGSAQANVLRQLVSRPRDLAVLLGGVAAAFVAVWALTGRATLGVMCMGAAVAFWVVAVRRRRRRWVEKIEEQFPEALSVIASSLQAGNPLRRSLQILAESGADPLAEEFARVVAETELGTPLVDAFDRMAERVDLPDVRWFARSLRIQQRTGGQLAPFVRTVAEVMTARAEMKREARVLTAEGRMSAFVLGALPALLVAACHAVNPDYLSPLFKGWGLAVLATCALSIALGIAWILHMVQSDVAR